MLIIGSQKFVIYPKINGHYKVENMTLQIIHEFGVHHFQRKSYVGYFKHGVPYL